MKASVEHVSAQAHHYDKEAAHYDAFNEERSASTNAWVASVLCQHGVYSVLDLMCGTGSQVFCLKEKGFDVVGVDINASMLSIARQKAQQAHQEISFEQGDVRTTQRGAFDAVVTMFNAIGHLTQHDFKKALHNIHANLKPGGLYLFDIFNELREILHL